MRLGPGKHLQGRSLMGGIVKPEEFDYFHEVHLIAWHWVLLLNFYPVHHSRWAGTRQQQSCRRRIAGWSCNRPPTHLELRFTRTPSQSCPWCMTPPSSTVTNLVDSFRRTGTGGEEVYCSGNQWSFCWKWRWRAPNDCCSGWRLLGCNWHEEVQQCLLIARIYSSWDRWITNGTFADYFTTGCKTDVSQPFHFFSCLRFLNARPDWIYGYPHWAWTRRVNETNQNCILLRCWHSVCYLRQG